MLDRWSNGLEMLKNNIFCKWIFIIVILYFIIISFFLDFIRHIHIHNTVMREIILLIFVRPQMLATFQLKKEIENYIFFHFQIFGIHY